MIVVWTLSLQAAWSRIGEIRVTGGSTEECVALIRRVGEALDAIDRFGAIMNQLVEIANGPSKGEACQATASIVVGTCMGVLAAQSKHTLRRMRSVAPPGSVPPAPPVPPTPVGPAS